MDQAFFEYTRTKGFRESTVRRLSALDAADQRAFMEIVTTLKASENHVRDMLDWLQEIALRDGIEINNVLSGELFAAILTDPRLGRSDKLRRVKTELRRIRLPRLSRIETEIGTRIQALKLKPQAKVMVPGGLEGGFLTVQLSARSHGELKQLLAELACAADKDEVKEIFALLDGRGMTEPEENDGTV